MRLGATGDKEKRTFACLVKFFRDERHLDELIAGKLYCNTPEFYRTSKSEGVSDPQESCSRAHRGLSGGDMIKLVMEGEEVASISNMTVHVGGLKDMWLHCWCALDIPESAREFNRLATSLGRLRGAFGVHYAVIPRGKLAGFTKAVHELAADRDFKYGRVQYSDNQQAWSVGCKATKYAYQQEYRFALGLCGHLTTEPLILRHPAGFAEFIQKSPAIEMAHRATGLVCRIDRSRCRVRLLSRADATRVLRPVGAPRAAAAIARTTSTTAK